MEIYLLGLDSRVICSNQYDKAENPRNRQNEKEDDRTPKNQNENEDDGEGKCISWVWSGR